MTKTMKQARYTRTQMIRWYRKYKEPGSTINQRDVAEKIGCHLSTVNKWFVAFDQEKVPVSVPLEEEPETAPAFGETHVSTEQALAEENAFLRWWNLGERRGWVSKLLTEVEKNG